jgi:hypothetical protein
MDRQADLGRLYAILESLKKGIGGKRSLADCDGRMVWPTRGVYFLFEPGESRSDTGMGPRVVRVGTHALKAGSGTSLWQRLSQHRGIAVTGGGNHRGSIFRLLVGTAIKSRDGMVEPSSWDVGADPGGAARSLGLTREQVLNAECSLELMVSEQIRRMPFLWLSVDDVAGPHSHRGLIERDAIALLSNHGKPAIDPPSLSWLGSHCNRERVRLSGLWNNNHVDEVYDPGFLDIMEQRVEAMTQGQGRRCPTTE